MSIFPRQKVSTTERKKRDEVSNKNWGELSVDYFIDETINTTNQDDILADYRLVEGELQEKDYNYILNPLNTTIDRYKRFGTVLRNFDIISPVINLYAGEFNQRFKNIQVLDSNPNEDNRYKEGLNELIKVYYNQELINDLGRLGIDTGKENIEQGSLKDKIEEYNRGYDENRVITGQEILDYIYYDQDIDDKHQDAYIDWLKAGMTVTYKGVFYNDIDYEVVPPWEVTLPTTIKSNAIEDADWITRRQVLKANQILDRWHDKLTEEDVSWLEEEARTDGYTNTTGYVRLSTEWISNKEDYAKHSLIDQVNGIEVYHVQWRSFRKVGILTFLNEIGQTEEVEVDDTYKLNADAGDIDIEWGWISQVWEGWRIGGESTHIYIDVRPLPYNRMELNNSSVQKLSYNGRINKTVTGKLLSIPSLGRPYQILYNVLHYQFEKVINKNKEKVMIMPLGLFPKGTGGWDEEKSMYYMNANGMLIIDETSPTASLALQGIKVLDMGLGNYAKEAIALMQSIKAEWWEAIGMNRQRYGDSKASDGKAVTEQAIFRSAIISDELNRKFEKFQETDYAGLLDISKIAYLEGIKGKYINSDGREAFLEINADNSIFHLESDYNVFVKNSRRENERIQMAKEYGFSIGQNGEATIMMELIGSTNFAKTKEIVKKIDALNKQREQAAQESAQASNEGVAKLKSESEQADRDVKIYEADKKYDTAIDSKLLELNQGETGKSEKEDADVDDNGVMDIETKKMNNHKINLDNSKLNLDKQDFLRRKKETDAKVKQMANNVNN